MYKVEGTTIKMTRGDTVEITVRPEMSDGTVYHPVEGDRVRFAVKGQLNGKGTAYKDTDPLINKQIPIDTMLLTLEPEDTKPLAFGQYTYDVELTTADGAVDTFIFEATLEIKPEVH